MYNTCDPQDALISMAALRESATATRRRAAELRHVAQALRAIALTERERAERDKLQIIDQLTQRAAPPVFDPRPYEPSQS